MILYAHLFDKGVPEQKWPWPPSISFRVKAEILSKAYKVLHGLTPFLTFSSPSTLLLAHHIRPTSPLLCFQCTKWVPSLQFLYCLFPPLGHSTCSYSLINCLTLRLCSDVTFSIRPTLITTLKIATHTPRHIHSSSQ